MLYSGYDDPKFAHDLAAFDDLCAQMNALAADESLTGLDLCRAYISLSERIEKVMRDMASFAELKASANTRDTQSASMMGRLMAKASDIAGATARIEARIAAIDGLDALAAADDDLKDYRYLLKCLRDDAKYLLSEREEEIISRLSISGSSAWGEMQQNLTSSVPVLFRGETTNLSSIRNMAYDPDPTVRREAYEAEIVCYDRIRDAVAYSLNSIKLSVLDECRLRGYESPLQRTLHGARMKKETLDALMSAIRAEGLGLFQRYLRAKARALGHKNGLPWYDLFAPMGGSSRRFTADEARDYLLGIFASFDRSLADMARRAFDERWIDFYPRDGKAGGAFCAGLPNQKQARILTNFDGAFGDVVTLAHELGHAYHDIIVFEHRPLNQGYSMPVAETASTFNENVVTGAAIRAASDQNEKLSLIESRLQDTCQIICDIYSRYLFETEVFKRRPEQFMSADDLCAIMLDCQKAAYGDGLDPDKLHPYMWVCKSHYYSGGLSFYNFPYAFGGLFARGLYAMYERDGSTFVPRYQALLKATSVMSVEDTARVADIDLCDESFWLRSLDSFRADVDAFESLTKAM